MKRKHTGFSLMELVIVMMIIAIVMKGGSAWIHHQQQKSYAQMYTQCFAMYEKALAMYYADNNGNVNKLLELVPGKNTAQALDGISILTPYLPRNFTLQDLPRSSSDKTKCAFQLFRNTNNDLSIRLANIPVSAVKVADTIVTLLRKNLGIQASDTTSRSISKSKNSNLYIVDYAIKTGTFVYL